MERSVKYSNSVMDINLLQQPDVINGTLSPYLDNEAISGPSFFKTYYAPERFVTECILATISITCNAVALGISRGHYYQHHAYHSVFKNMALANTLASLSSWLCNNSLYLFAYQFGQMTDICQVLVILLALNMCSTIFGLVSGMSMVGFGVIHYSAICWPMRYDSMVTHKRVRITLATVWTLSLLASIWPLLAQANYIRIYGDCSIDYVGWLTHAGANASMSLLCICYVTLAVLCIRIYCQICKLQKRLASTFCDLDDLQFEQKAFWTIAMLLSTTTIFFLPFCIVYVISINCDSSPLNDNKAVLFYMNLLPYVKYATDPVIYGKRMLGLQEQLQKRVNEFCCVRWREYTRSSTTAREDLTRKGQLYHMATPV